MSGASRRRAGAAPGFAKLGRARGTLTVLLLANLATVPSQADIVLHEFIAPDATEDLRMGATTGDGTMAAAIDTRSGAVASPDPTRASAGKRHVYGWEGVQGPGGSYRIDSDTSRPEHVGYEDPFTPAVAPYKREIAFDTVDSEFDLGVSNASLERLAVGGPARADDDQFYAELTVEVTTGTPSRIPTVGPSARVLALRAAPEARIELFRDAADNWFARGDREGRFGVVLHLAIDRAIFGSAFANVEWPRLYRLGLSVPDVVRREGTSLARQIGIVDGSSPAETVRGLVAYFRGFSPSTERPSARGVELYRELVLSRKGVCRHRAYAFVVTALALGLPSRFVHNEAHAWVEVNDGTRWHRIDLGGAASDLSYSAESIAHVPPRDPFAWPAGEDSGRMAAGRSQGPAPSSRGDPSVPSASGSSVAPSGVAPSPLGEQESDDHRPGARVTLSLAGNEALRGARVRAAGEVTSSAGACAAVRVDLFLQPTATEDATGARIPLGTLVTSEEGRYDGYVVVPYAVPPGDYEVRASTPGGAVCGEGTSR